VLKAWKAAGKPPYGVVEWAAGPPHISIDPNGNLTQKSEGSTTWTYEWNAENQLTRVLSNGSEVARYKYDALGRRVEKVAGSTATAWAYDFEDILRETTGGASWKYVHGPGIDEPLAKEDGIGALTHFHVDGLSSVAKTTNGVGAVNASHSYDAFGVMAGGASGYSYTGREWDADAGLYYYRARWYDASSGRFLGQDPLFLEGWTNLYAYVEGNPTNWIDPMGETKGGPQNISVNHGGRELTKKTPLPELKACLKEAIEKAMSPEHIKKLRGLIKVVKRGGGMVMAFPLVDTSLAELDRWQRAQACPGGCTMQEQLCKDLEEAGNPEFVLGPAGLFPNPCKPLPFSNQRVIY
jgi:RHS repeat-associated protein